MKNLLVFLILSIFLRENIYSQNNLEKIKPPFFNIHQRDNYEQNLKRESGNRMFQGTQKDLLKKMNKENELIIYRPVSITWSNSDRDLYTYDNFGNCLMDLNEILSDNIWANYFRVTYNYDNSGNIIKELNEGWSGSEWSNGSRDSNTYDISGNIITKIRELWSIDRWEFSQRFNYTYNESGKLLTYVCENNYRYSYTYDNSGNLLTVLIENWGNNTWIHSARYTYTYDNSGNQLTYLLELWSYNAWVNSSRYTYTYDNTDRCITSIMESWFGNTWGNISKDIYTYSDNGKSISILSYSWINNWEISNNYTYNYDSFGNLLILLVQNWSDGMWINSWKDSYSYDDNGNCIHGEGSIWNDGSWNLLPDNLQIWYDHHHYYKQNNASTANAEYISITDIKYDNSKLIVYSLSQNYPNPFNPNTTINYSIAKAGFVKLSIYDITGSRIETITNEYQSAGNYSVHFNGNNFASGIYLYRLESGNYSAAKKFILMK